MLASSQLRNVAHRRSTPTWSAALLRGTFELLLSVRRRWRLHRMQWLDDHMLDDIGITRDELEWAIRLPLRTNAALALHWPFTSAPGDAGQRNAKAHPGIVDPRDDDAFPCSVITCWPAHPMTAGTCPRPHLPDARGVRLCARSDNDRQSPSRVCSRASAGGRRFRRTRQGDHSPCH